MGFTATALTVFRVLASCTSLMMLLSPCFMVYKFYKDKSTGVLSIVPLASLLVNAHMWMAYGYLDNNYVPVFVTYVFGDVLAVSYIAVFYRYTKDRARAKRVLAVTAVLLTVITVYLCLGANELTGQSHDSVAATAGAFAIVTALTLYASPLEKVMQVIRHRSGAFIPIHMVCAGFLNNNTWIVYSLLAKKWMILSVCVVSFSFSLSQIVLYFFIFHPSTHPYEPRSFTVETEDAENPKHEFLAMQTPRQSSNERR